MAKKQKKKKTAVVVVKPPKVLIAAVAVIAVGAIAFGVYIYQHDQKALDSDTKIVAEQQQALETCAASVRETLTTASGVSKVYDSSGNMLFMLRGAAGVEGVQNLPPQLASDIQSRLIGSQLPAKIDLDAWSKGHTVFGGLMDNRTVDELSSHSLGYRAVGYFCDYTQTMLSDQAKFVLGAALDEQFTEQELLCYCASVGKFGNISGLVPACEQWFSKSVDKLNEWQLHYVGYAFANANASWEDFVEKHSDWTGGAENAGVFGFKQTGGDPYWLLKQRISDELNTVVGTDWDSQNLTVKLGLNSALQSEVQQALDDGLKASITLGADGQTAVDGVVGVVNPRTGFVEAYVGGRSLNNIAREFTLPHESHIGNYVEAARLLEEDPTLTYASLIGYETASGQTDYAPFGELAYAGQLSLMGGVPELKSSCRLGELLDFGASLYVSDGPRFISQVLGPTGDTVYTAPQISSTAAMFPNPDVRCLLTGNTEGAVTHYYADNEVGVVFGEFTSEYIVGVLTGTNAQGYSMSYEDMDLCATSALNIAKVVAKHYPKEPELNDANGAVAAKVAEAYTSNAQVVTDAVESWVADLKQKPINSVGTRADFEAAYGQYSSQLYAYGGLISSELFTELQSKLDGVRIERTDELMQFIA